MTATVNASTSAGVVVTSDTSGSLALQTGGTTALTISSAQVVNFANAPALPSGSITQASLATGVAGTGPAFSAYSASTQTVSASTWTKVVLGTEEFDTNNNFASSTFTPTVAGYYQVSGCIQFNSTVSVSRGFVAIYKNGSAFKYLSDLASSVSRTGGSCLIYMNGTTDYLELYGYMTGAGTLYFDTSQLGTYFQASLVRSA
jgi:hypothetical protein